MRNWEKYYRNPEVTSLRVHLPYYHYVLEDALPEIENHLGEKEVMTAALGGIDPTVSRPEDFILLCQKVISHHPVSFYIIDQNHRALADLQGTQYQTLQAQLEGLPADLPPLHLLVCDYTLDFMSDEQLRALNRSLPNRLHPLGLFVVASGDDAFPIISRLASRAKCGVSIYPRSQKRLVSLLPDLKPVYLAQIDSVDHLGDITVFARRDSPTPRHVGAGYGLRRDKSSFSDWCLEHGYFTS